QLNLTTSSFSARNELLALIDPLGHVTSYTYDAIGRTANRTWATGVVTTYSYDPVGRPASVMYIDGSRITHQYDPIGNRTTMIDTIGVCTFAYDPRDLLVGRTDYSSNTMVYSYDPKRRRSTFVEPGGLIRTFTYDADDRVTVYQAPAGFMWVWTTYTYDKLGRVTVMQSLGGPQELTTYDSAGQITSILHNASGPTLLNWLTYMYDPNGNVVTEVDFQMGYSTTYAYDPNDRLLGYARTQGSTTTLGTYAYDRLDNLIVNSEGSVNRFILDAASRIVTAQSFAGNLVTYVWDANDNNTAVQDSGNGYYTMTYDFENRLKSHMRPDALLATYAYDGDGLKRLELEYNGVVTLMWDGDEYVQMQMFVDGYEDSATVPATMTHSLTYTVTMTWRNWPLTAAPWMGDRGYQLWQVGPGAPFSPQSVYLNAGEVIPALSYKTFVFTVTAPSTPGTYTLQYQMYSNETIQFGPQGNPHPVTVV
ncbi:MAG TPA: hypothetical protein VKT78_18710, partial [Fimbriimonadaceae bacterium]|nr:hypothetical protein [Fimbriimonadaceae bacterium]